MRLAHQFQGQMVKSQGYGRAGQWAYRVGLGLGLISVHELYLYLNFIWPVCYCIHYFFVFLYFLCLKKVFSLG